jgi:hypothetical protein
LTCGTLNVLYSAPIHPAVTRQQRLPLFCFDLPREIAPRTKPSLSLVVIFVKKCKAEELAPGCVTQRDCFNLTVTPPMMASFPEHRQLPVNHYPQHSVHDAYDLCLQHEHEAGNDVQLLMYARCLGYLITEAPTDGARDYIATEILTCMGDGEKMNELARFHINHLFRLCEFFFDLPRYLVLIFFQSEGRKVARLYRPANQVYLMRKHFSSHQQLIHSPKATKPRKTQ